MLRKLLLALLCCLSLTTGCGRGEYDEKVNQAIRKAKSPPEETQDANKEEAGDEADPAEQKQ